MRIVHHRTEPGATSTPAPDVLLIHRLRRELEARLDSARLTHVMGVESFAIILARRHGVDPRRALLAALLHDLCKQDPKDHQRAAAERCRAVPVTARDLEFKPLWHAFAAAERAATDFAIGDPELLRAVACHPTGDPGFGPLGMVLYVADHIEPGRDFDGVCAIRREALAAATLREAALLVARTRLAHLEAQGRPAHPRTAAFLQSLAAPGTHPT